MARVDRLEPGQQLNTGTPVVPCQAATVIVLRGGDETLEVLLVRRTLNARFMAGAWVFPGGAVDPGDGTTDRAHRLAAVRELDEEAGIGGVDPDSLVPFSRWITPAAVTVRFDTHFFLAPLPEGATPRVDGEECIDLGWFTPRDALDADRDGRLSIMFPTRKHLEQLSAFASAGAVLQHARSLEITAVEPRMVEVGGEQHILLPGEPGYEEAL
jgi:8-oxo-dGTP pyrophosphatase MutT (NUDIX family)